MNVFLYELRRRRKALALWSIGIVVFMVMCMGKYDALANGGPGIQEIMNQFPHTMQAVFGMSGLDVTSVAGYFGICFLYLALLLAVYAGLLGTGILAEEEQDKTTEFLYVKPISRMNVITQKLAAGIVNIAVVWLVTVASAWVSISTMASMSGFERYFWLFMAAALLISCTFFFLGTAVAAVVKNSSSPVRYVAIFIFASYVLYVLSKLSAAFDVLRYGSVFRYFDAVDVLRDGSLNLGYSAVCLSLMLLCIVATYWRYTRRDLEA